MPHSSWLPLDAMQAGALFALALGYFADALARKDRLVGWLGLTCAIIGFRHLAMVLGAEGVFGDELTDRLQSLSASFGFLGLLAATHTLFPRHMARPAVAAFALGMVPNVARNLFLDRSSSFDLPLHNISNLSYFAGAVWISVATWRARRDGDPMASRLLWGIVGLCVPVVVEVFALVFFQARLRLSGLALMLLAIAIAGSWLKVTMQDQVDRLKRSQEEAKAWRTLVPGPTWHTAEPSLLMENLFGREWPGKLAERMESLDGSAFELHRVGLGAGDSLGWIETRVDTLPGSAEFMKGWTVALGMDEPGAAADARAWLEAWGAEVSAWGTVPPREGPYPSFLVWGREPSILAVWREDALDRRRCRWVQVGGPATDGPHERIPKPLDEIALRLALQRLLSVR
jgi:hypothetical protein